MMKVKPQRQALQFALQPATELPFDVLGAKLRVPAARPGSVSRNALVNRLRATRGGGVVSLVAPAGYGKTTTLVQWAERDDRHFAWVSLDRRDNEPIVLLRHLAAALDAIEALPPAALDALAAPGDSVWTTALPRLTAALGSVRASCVIVLDNASVLRSTPVAEVLMAVVEHLPPSSALVLAGRSAPPLPLGRLRAEGRLLELGRDLLALSRREAQQLLRATGTALLPHELEPLVARSEGWAAGLFLGALALDEGGAPDVAGDERYLSDYFRASCMQGLDAPLRAFLRRTSVLDRLSGPLCDAVLERTGSALELEKLERAGLFVIPLDRRREGYRYHPLFRDFLLRELREHEPDAAHRLNMRASEWLEFVGDLEGAIAPAAAAGDVERTVRLIAAVGAAALDRGELPSVERWVALVPRGPGRDPDPAVSVVAALAHAHAGRTTEAERWLAAGERRAGESPALLSLARAAFCGAGALEMLATIELALRELPAGSPWEPRAHLLHGVALALVGDGAAADTALALAADEAAVHAAPGVRAPALAHQALLALERGELESAASAAAEAVELAADLTDDAAAIVPHAAAARVLLRQSRFDEARAELAAAERLEPLLTPALPWLAVGARLELARAHLALRDAGRVSELLADVAAIERLVEDVGVLGAARARLQAEADLSAEPQPGVSSGLTSAELRLLPLLATHLSFREIGERLYLSRHTVKTQAISMYRKLGASSRSEAIQIAADLGLLEAAA